MINKDNVSERLAKIFTPKESEAIAGILCDLSTDRLPELYTVAEVAKALRLSESMIRKAAADHKLKCVRFGPKGGRIRFYSHHIEKYVEEHVEGHEGDN